MSLLKDLGKDPDVMIKRSDKCKGLVILPKNKYIHKAKTITDGYEPVSKNPTPRLEAETKRLIEGALAEKVSDKVIKSVIPSGSRTAELYGLPKTHSQMFPYVLSYLPAATHLISLRGYSKE